MKKETVETLKKMKYEDFLQTDYWKMVSEQARINAHYKCQLCGCNDKKLNVHHNTYEHRGEEFKHMEDLVCLCEDCHRYYHNKNQILEEREESKKQIKFWQSKLFQTIDDLNQTKDDLDYAEWKLRNFYDSQKSHTYSEIQNMVDSSLREYRDIYNMIRENRDDVPF